MRRMSESSFDQKVKWHLTWRAALRDRWNLFINQFYWG